MVTLIHILIEFSFNRQKIVLSYSKPMSSKEYSEATESTPSKKINDFGPQD